MKTILFVLFLILCIGASVIWGLVQQTAAIKAQKIAMENFRMMVINQKEIAALHKALEECRHK